MNSDYPMKLLEAAYRVQLPAAMPLPLACSGTETKEELVTIFKRYQRSSKEFKSKWDELLSDMRAANLWKNTESGEGTT